MTIHAIIIGDEILSGRRQDKHMFKLISVLQERGLVLNSAEYVGDDLLSIKNVISRTFATFNNEDDVVICFGGIGATPDDRTRQAVALATSKDLILFEEAKFLIQKRIAEMHLEGKAPADFNHPENLQRLKMGEFPQGSELVPNSYNHIPAFSLGNHYFLPGFPIMAWQMLEWIFDNNYKHLHNSHEEKTLSCYIPLITESKLAPILFEVESIFDGIKTYSLPSFGIDNKIGDNEKNDWRMQAHIEAGVKGKSITANNLNLAFHHIIKKVEELNYNVFINNN
jgi:molybdopterin-biosynthesis enzyme MoeA-like protein